MLTLSLFIINSPEKQHLEKMLESIALTYCLIENRSDVDVVLFFGEIYHCSGNLSENNNQAYFELLHPKYWLNLDLLRVKEDLINLSHRQMIEIMLWQQKKEQEKIVEKNYDEIPF